MRHWDFERIKNEFVNYYKNQSKGEYEYYEWLRALRLDETLPYNQARESFQWAQDMISLIKEDADSKYYKVLLAFPIKSMNGNVYKERELLAAATRIKGASPDMNHKEEFWFSPDNIYNRWGSVTTEGAKYEDGAVEVIMKVPKTTLCPVCNEKNKPLFKLIDEKKIVNVSLNGFNATQDGGFQFNEKIPYTLLTSDVLPGIPLARIFPIESFLPFSQSSNMTKTKRRIKIVGINEKYKVAEPFADYADFADCVSKNQDKEDPEAYCGQIKHQTEQAMPENQVCPEGEHYDSNQQKCVANEQVTNPISKKPAEITQTPVGSSVAPDAGKIQGESIPALKVRTLKAERVAENLQLAKAELEKNLEEAYDKNSKQQGVITTQTATIEKLEKQITALNSEKVTDGVEAKSLNRRLEDMTGSRDDYKKQAEQATTKLEVLETKYRELLKKDLALSNSLTDKEEELRQTLQSLNLSEATVRKQKSLANKIRITGMGK